MDASRGVALKFSPATVCIKNYYKFGIPGGSCAAHWFCPHYRRDSGRDSMM